ncbi:uncharacterized protein LOC121790731 [Salvia splendens]|uniref:uncharacterized protein LOC121790731 n=1 Tax=Salvia splendens TaxID=180675 RepID=UPI001C25E760|nr:uncharacterized protein LOC121790731 [Salvia splendens]
MQANNDLVRKLQDTQQEQKAAMDMLAKQMSHIATSLNEMRGNEGRIPASVKPPDRANISQITLRSGREYKGPTMKIDDQELTVMRTKVENEEVRRESGEFFKGDSSKTVKPFPYRGEARKRKDDQALKLPLFSKFIKEFIAGKTKSDGKIVIGENISAVIQKRRLSSKRTDPSMFALPISIGNVKIEHAMCDLGASINVLPLSLSKKLADRSCISPECMLENVIVKVHDFLYPVDFHVIKMSEHESAESRRVLLGRPFLRTTKTIIDVFDGRICLDYHGEKFTFNIDEALKKPLDVENLHAVDIINPLVQEYLETKLMQE